MTQVRTIDTILEFTKRFVDSRRKSPAKVESTDGPFKYVYVALTHVVGAKLPSGSDDPLEFASFQDVNGRAYLTHDWEREFFHIDRGNAFAGLLLTGLIGAKRFGKVTVRLNNLLRWAVGREKVFLRNLEREIARSRQERLKSHSGSGCCLAFVGEGGLVDPIELKIARRIGNVGIALDAIDGNVYRKMHHTNVRNTATAVSIALSDTSGSPETKFLTDSVYLLGRDGLVIYARTFKAGAAAVSVTTMPTEQLLDDVRDYVSALQSDRRLASAGSLYTLSQRKSNDNLRAFIASWASLESLINYLEKTHREAWRELLQSGSSKLPDWDKQLHDLHPYELRLRDKFYAVACHLSIDTAEVDSAHFVRLNGIRGDYYHAFDVDDNDLPTHDVRILFRKYLKLGLQHAQGVG